MLWCFSLPPRLSPAAAADARPLLMPPPPRHRALELLGAMVADEPGRLRWLLGAGVLQLLERLCLDRDDCPAELSAGAEAAGAAAGAPSSPALQPQRGAGLLPPLQPVVASPAAAAWAQRSACADGQCGAPAGAGGGSASGVLSALLGMSLAASSGGATQLQAPALLLQQPGPSSASGGISSCSAGISNGSSSLPLPSGSGSAEAGSSPSSGSSGSSGSSARSGRSTGSSRSSAL
jgi:hypothetical protein